MNSFVIPNSVTSIGDNSFGGSGLTSITIPKSVITIGQSAFKSSTSLTSTPHTGVPIDPGFVPTLI